MGDGISKLKSVLEKLINHKILQSAYLGLFFGHGSKICVRRVYQVKTTTESPVLGIQAHSDSSTRFIQQGVQFDISW